MSDYILTHWITKEKDVREINLYLYELMTELYEDMSDLDREDRRGYDIECQGEQKGEQYTDDSNVCEDHFYEIDDSPYILHTIDSRYMKDLSLCESTYEVWVEIDYTRLPTMHYEYSATSIDELRKIVYFGEEAICYLKSDDVNVFDEDMTKMYYNAFAQEDEVKDGDPVTIEEGHLRFTFTPTSITVHNEEYRTFLSTYETCTRKEKQELEEKRNYWRNKIETDIEYVLDRLQTLEQK